ncbi:MAG: ABC transporter substrate-binding protein [Streptosporangiaceae bacterium]|jgi:peptide/nickel transport system substrate-binding protein
MRPVLPTAAAVAAALIALAGCGSAASPSGGSGSATTRSGTFTVGMGEAATTMDPTSVAPAAFAYYDYDPLIHEEPNGTFTPDLALTWGYVGTGNKEFEVTLRHGVHFSDGSLMTATAVQNSLEYYVHNKNADQQYAGPVSSVTTDGEWTVLIHYSAPFPDAVVSLTQDWDFGNILGPKGIADPSSLANSSDGAGEYVLQPSQTVAGTTYVSTPDSHYWNQSAIKFDKVVIKPFTSETAEIAALQSGQIDFAQNIAASEVATVQSSGDKISDGPSTWASLMLENRVSGPLANVKVRQALQYAINRPAIVKAIYYGYGSPQEQWAIQGLTGYIAADANEFAYDPAKAKQLLAAAGYPSGFSISMLDVAALDKNGVLAQAVASDLEAVGVKVTITESEGTFATLQSQLFSKKYETLVMPTKAQDIYSMAGQTLVASSFALANAFGTSSSQMNALYAQVAAASTPAAVTAASQALNTAMDSNAWFVPIALVLSMQATASSVQNVPSSFLTVDQDPVSPVTSQNWALAG